MVIYRRLILKFFEFAVSLLALDDNIILFQALSPWVQDNLLLALEDKIILFQGLLTSGFFTL